VDAAAELWTIDVGSTIGSTVDVGCKTMSGSAPVEPRIGRLTAVVEATGVSWEGVGWAASGTSLGATTSSARDEDNGAAEEEITVVGCGWGSGSGVDSGARVGWMIDSGTPAVEPTRELSATGVFVGSWN
jgi:hypothetical protein